MAEVEFMSSVGISTLIGAYKKVTAQKNKVVLASMGPALRNVLKATGLLRMFQIERTERPGRGAIKKDQCQKCEGGGPRSKMKELGH